MRGAAHPLAWWGWALGLAVATTRVTDALVLVAIAASAVAVVVLRPAPSTQTRLLPAYLALACVIVSLRIGFYVVLGIKTPGRVLVDLPTVKLPEWAAGIEVFGPVTAAGLGAAATGGLRLATLVLCFGAANMLVDPRRALRCLPGSMHHLGTAVVIAISVAPQLATAAGDVRRAQRLRGARPSALRAGVTPVLADAVDRSLALAASMDARGYARTLPGRSGAGVAALLLIALLGAGVGVYGLLGGTAMTATIAALTTGAGAATLATWLAGRQIRRTRYRPDPWQAPETITATSGIGAAVAALAMTGAGAATAVVVTVLALAPALVTRGSA